MRNWTVLFWKLHDSYYDPHEPMYSKKQGVGDKAPAGSRRPDCVLARREARQVEVAAEPIEHRKKRRSRALLKLAHPTSIASIANDSRPTRERFSLPRLPYGSPMESADLSALAKLYLCVCEEPVWPYVFFSYCYTSP